MPALELECLDALRIALKPLRLSIVDLETKKTPASAWEVLWAIITAYRTTLRDRPAYERLIGSILASSLPVVDGDDRALAIEKMFQALDVLTDSIKYFSLVGVFSPASARDRALVLWLMVHGVLQLKKMEDASEGLIDVERLLQVGLKALLMGWSSNASPKEGSLTSDRLDLAGSDSC